jgi:regulator of protease activity HflC (stomatin/prohibitin superfamily)
MAKYPDPLDTQPPPRKKYRFWRFVWRHLLSLTFWLMVLLLAGTVLWPYMVITVPSGSVAVLWKRFNGFGFQCWCFIGRGTVLDPRELKNEGLHVIWPWNELFLYNLRLQSTTQTYNGISMDGVSVSVQIVTRFQLRHDAVGVLHKFIGPRYKELIIDPLVGSKAREVISQYSAQEVYRSRELIQNKIQAGAQRALVDHLNDLVQPQAVEQPDPRNYNDFLRNSMQIFDALLLSIQLPPAIVAAINRQTEQFYQIQEYKFRVAREAEEASRKQIEANGIAAFQRTVSQGISDSYLRWRGIEATLALSQSPNSKIVVIGSGKDGLPIILGNVDSPASGAAARQTGDAAPHDAASESSAGPTDKKSLAADPPSDPADAKEEPSNDPAGTKKGAATGSPTDPAKSRSSSVSPLDWSLDSILARFYQGVGTRPTGSDMRSGTAAQPKP